MIKRIKVYTEDALKDRTYRFPGNYGVEKFLEIFSGKKKTFINFFNDKCAKYQHLAQYLSYTIIF